MGIFGGLKSGANIDPSMLSKLSFGDRARLFAIGMNDPSAAMQMKQQMQIRPAQQAFMSNLEKRLGPQYAETQGAGAAIQAPSMPGMPQAEAAPEYQWQAPQRTSDGLNINSPELGGIAMQAERLGVPITTLMDVLKAQQPKWQQGADGRYVNTVGSTAPRASAVGGILTDASGAASQQGGYAAALAGIEGAKAGAQEYARAAQDIVKINVNGVPTEMTRAQAAQRFRDMEAPPQPGGGQAGQGNGQPQGIGFGVGLSPGQQKAQEVDYEGGAKLIAGAQEAGMAANTNNRNARMAFDAVLQLDPNNLTGFRLGAAKLMRSLYPQSPELEQFVSTADGFRMLTTRMVLPKAKELGANPSNKDSEIIFKSMPGLTTPRQAGAVYFALESASSAKEAARQEFFQNWEGQPSQKAIQRAWSQSDGAKRSVFQDEAFSRLQINGHPAVVQKTGKDGQRYGIFMPYTANGQPNPSAQVFRIY
jgi:hypothetical protein